MTDYATNSAAECQFHDPKNYAELQTKRKKY
jgi:hypothetical protein